MTTGLVPQKNQPAPAAGPQRSKAEPEEPRGSGAPQENVISAWLARHEFALRRLHSATGLLFGLFVVMHLLVNATLIEGVRYDGQTTVYQLQVDKIHGLPFLNLLAWLIILLPILFHTVYGLLIVTTGRPNIDRYGYPRNWAYVLQRISALVLVLFIAFHYLSMKGAFGGELGRALTFVPVDSPQTAYSEATQSTVNHLHAAWWVGWFVYPIGILAATFHTAAGFWTAAITWGITVSARAQQLWFGACVGIFILLTILGYAALIGGLASDATDEPTLGQQIIDPRLGEKAPDPQTLEELEAPATQEGQEPKE